MFLSHALSLSLRTSQMARFSLHALAAFATAAAATASAATCTYTNYDIADPAIVTEFAPHYTGETVNTFSAATGTAPAFALQPTFDLFVPMSKYPNAIGFTIENTLVSEGITLEASSIALFSGDLGNFFQIDPTAFSVFDDGELVFNGVSLDPLVKYSIVGEVSNSNLASYSVNFLITIIKKDPAVMLTKRAEDDQIEVNLVVTNPNYDPNATTTGTGTTSGTATGTTTGTTSGTTTGTTTGTGSNAADSTGASVSGSATGSDSTTGTTTGTVAGTATGTAAGSASADGTTSVQTNINTHTVLSVVSQTITSCSNNKCHETVQPVVETEVPITINDLVIYTKTYCPVNAEGEIVTPTAAPKINVSVPSEGAKPIPTTAIEQDTTVTNTVTNTQKVHPSVSVSSATTQSATVGPKSEFEGAANKVNVVSGLSLFALAAMLI